jgi:hypothetical protein
MSSEYTRLRTVAEQFIQAYDFDESNNPKSPQEVLEAMMAQRASTCKQRWGHAVTVSQMPAIQGQHDNETFGRHLLTMVPHIKSVSSPIHDVLVDEPRRKVTVQASHIIWPKGAEERVENDLVWILEIAKDEDKVVNAIEYLDALATQRIVELVGQYVTASAKSA